MVNTAFVIAGSEATGGAGIQVDLKTFQQLGVYGMGAITCIVSFDPNNNWAHRFVPVDPQVIQDQIEAATSCHDVSTVKIGMLGTPATIAAVAESLKKQTWTNVVLDPVLICKGQEPGAALDTDTALRDQILPLATVVTPNHFEALTLSGMEKIETVDDLIEAAKLIHAQGPAAVIVKGGVSIAGPDAVDVLFDGTEVTILSAPKVGELRVSGAGCTFAAAVTAELAKGATIKAAAQTAKKLVTAGIAQRMESNAPFTSVWQGATLI